MTNNSNKMMADFFYEQCAGTLSGHMAPVPNNPVLFGLMSVWLGTNDNRHAATKAEFAELIRKIADELDS
jgi:hypothetical protein